jgi:hypothetical protein
MSDSYRSCEGCSLLVLERIDYVVLAYDLRGWSSLREMYKADWTRLDQQIRIPRQCRPGRIGPGDLLLDWGECVLYGAGLLS